MQMAPKHEGKDHTRQPGLQAKYGKPCRSFGAAKDTRPRGSTDQTLLRHSRKAKQGIVAQNNAQEWLDKEHEHPTHGSVQSPDIPDPP
ncbi:hypothetical protein PsYK624_083640 [Phanerochaete sordida]|uniref:Uncharacterized protein n=1 Tax=Phanerochaete sordida TaxID=48140 RepID=A0A9P3GC81_9APHY|nr:hypothetical protein PsYK624_083640 [Phanerochaete sordida]